jgi:hypothetical protein
LSYFNQTGISGQIFKKYSKSNFMEFYSMEAELFHMDRETDMTKQIVVFHNFANAPENVYTQKT